MRGAEIEIDGKRVIAHLIDGDDGRVGARNDAGARPGIGNIWPGR